MDLSITDERSDMILFHSRTNRLLIAMMAMVVMVMLKRHYSMAGPEQLLWILLPTARLLALLTGTDPVWEAGVGYVDFSRGIVIAPACAGVNFVIMAFALAVFCGLARLRRFSVLAAWLAFSFFGAYICTLGTNTLRIAVSMALYRADIYNTWLSPAALHRLVGVWLYLGALGLFFKGLAPIIDSFAAHFEPCCRSNHLIWPSWLPLGWYLLGAVGVPAVNLVFRRPPPAFGKHCLMVVASAVILWIVVVVMRRLVDRYGNRNVFDGKHTDCGR